MAQFFMLMSGLAELKDRRNAAMISFEEFWLNYPRKVGRVKAERLWKKLKDIDKFKACSGLMLWKQTAQWHQADGQFIPYASTFLAQKRYLDEPWTGAFEGR
jgi:hypothetical protein